MTRMNADKNLVVLSAFIRVICVIRGSYPLIAYVSSVPSSRALSALTIRAKMKEAMKPTVASW